MTFNPIFKGLIIFETKNFRVEQDWEVPIPGFFIVAPKKKASSIADFTEKELIEFIKITKEVRKGMRKVLRIKTVYLFQNEDSVHGFHLWMFPLYSWMEKKNFGYHITLIKPSMKYAKENMMDKKTISKVKKSVEKMKKYLKDFSP
jgi:diadenosine tetraphosphate (Ap4A) HIT family hydrolase